MIEMKPEIRRIPAWAVILIVAACVAGAAWFLWKFTKPGGDTLGDDDLGDIVRLEVPAASRPPSPTRDTITVKRDPNATDSPRGPRFGGRSGTVGPRRTGGGLGSMFGDGVRQTPGGWRVYSGDTRASIDTSSIPPRIDFTYIYSRFIPVEVIRPLQARWNVLNNPAIAAEAKVTPQQLQQLRAVGEGSMAVTDAERQEFAKLWTQREQATADARGPADEALVKALGAISAAHLGAFKENYTSRAQKVKSILSDEQLTQIQSASARAPGTFRPASRPSTRRATTGP